MLSSDLKDVSNPWLLIRMILLIIQVNLLISRDCSAQSPSDHVAFTFSGGSPEWVHLESEMHLLWKVWMNLVQHNSVSFWYDYSCQCSLRSPTPHVSWVRVGQAMPSQARQESYGQELVIENVKAEDAGRYECQGINDEAPAPVKQSFYLSVECKFFEDVWNSMRSHISFFCAISSSKWIGKFFFLFKFQLLLSGLKVQCLLIGLWVRQQSSFVRHRESQFLPISGTWMVSQFQASWSNLHEIPFSQIK